jgi:group I intron endonuclease
VYSIVNTRNGKVYVGSSNSARRRFAGHRSLLRRNRHPNGYLQRAWNKNGEASFTFNILESVPLAEQIKAEQRWINALRSFDRTTGYNLSLSASRHHFGVPHSATSKRKISQAKKGVGKGIPHGPMPLETKLKLSKAIKGRHFHTAAAKRRIGWHSKRCVRTPIWRAKISAAQKGIPRWSLAERQRISRQLTGHKQSAKTRAKRSATLIKLFSTADMKEQRSAWCKRAWTTRKACTRKDKKKK